MNLKNIFKLVRNLKVITFEKGEIIIPEGSKQNHLYFIRKGLVRSFLRHEKGENITFQLYAENKAFTNAHTILLNEPSKFSYQALENTKVYTIDYEHFMNLTSNNPDLLQWNRRFLGKRIIQQAFQRAESFVFLTPEERYKKYVKENPKIANRAPDMYIAHVLGITPVSLSRLRNRIATKK